MRACANGRKEIATILYHWNSTAAKIPNNANMSCIQLAKMSSCPELGTMLEKLEQKRRQQSEPGESSSKCSPESDVIFVKPSRAPSLDRQVQSPLATTSTMRSALASVRSVRCWSPACSTRDEAGPREVIRLRLRKQPSVDSGINLDSANVKNMHKDIKQLTK